MDHRYIEEHDIVSRHVMGKLSAQESAAFEEHFVDCQQCLEQLELVDDFRNALKQVAAEDAAAAPLSTPTGFAGWLARFNVWQQAALLACASLLLAAAPAALLLRQVRHTRQAVETSQDWQRRYEAERQAGGALERRLQEAERKSQDQARVPGEPGDLSRLPAVASVFTLNIARSAEAGPSEPVNRIMISPSPHWIVLSLDRGNEPEFQSYRAAVEDAKGSTLWKQSGLRPTSADPLAITLPSGLFRQGDYRLTLEGFTRGGRFVPVAHYSFRVTLRR